MRLNRVCYCIYARNAVRYLAICSKSFFAIHEPSSLASLHNAVRGHKLKTTPYHQTRLALYIIHLADAARQQQPTTTTTTQTAHIHTATMTYSQSIQRTTSKPPSTQHRRYVDCKRTTRQFCSDRRGNRTYLVHVHRELSGAPCSHR